jgi:hypothetical protein
MGQKTVLQHRMLAWPRSLTLRLVRYVVSFGNQFNYALSAVVTVGLYVEKLHDYKL